METAQLSVAEVRIMSLDEGTKHESCERTEKQHMALS